MRALLLMAVGSVVLMAERPDTDFKWRGAVAPGRLLEIQGINGDIHAVPSASGEVELVAKVTVDGVESSPVKVHLMPSDRGLKFCAIRMDESQCQPDDSLVTGPGTRVDFYVSIPEGVSFRGRTVNGGVEADALRSDVEAYTVNGGVRISTSGSARARTVNGSITAELSSPLWKQTPQFSTVNGGITLSLPPRANASLVAETRNGKILTSNLRPLRGKVTDQVVDVMIGTGNCDVPLTLRTVNGTILLKRS